MFLMITVLMILTSCKKNRNDDVIPELKDVFENAFMIGTALNHRQIYGEDRNGIGLVKSHFNSITPENVTKWGPINPRPG